MKLIIAFIALLGANAPALASDVALKSEVFVERVQRDDKGNSRVVLEEPKMVVPGDKLLFVLAYRNEGKEAADDFVINNPIPEAVSFTGTDSAEAVLSVDGGKSWGQLATLKVAQPDGTMRPAAASDVTNISWRFAQPIAVGASGKVDFRAVVK